MRRVLFAALIVTAGLTAVGAQGPAPGEAAPRPRVPVPLADALLALKTWPDNAPKQIRGLSPRELEARWPGWVRQRDAEIRARVESGDEDSLVNLWLYGTSFTRRPRAVETELSRLGRGVTPEQFIDGRLDDLLDSLVEPGSNERLQFVREVLARRGLDSADRASRGRIRQFLMEARDRVTAEFREYDRRVQGATRQGDASDVMSLHAVLFRERGLSSDTSVLVNFAVDQALRAIMSGGALKPGSVRRVAIVGPGLDITNKTEGHDFYPLQTLQPFSVMHSSITLGLADASQLHVTSFDLSARVNRHLAAARRRAEAGSGYVLHLALPSDEPWRRELLAFRSDFGRNLGDSIAAVSVPATAGAMAISAVQIRPKHVLAMTPEDLNVIVERPTPLPPDERFDLIVATNILVYYDRFEQALALSNLASMLRPGGLLLTNTAVFPVPPFRSAAHYLRVAYSERLGDDMFWYERE